MNKPSHEQSDNLKPGLVISYYGNSVAVEAVDGQVFQCHLKRNQALPVVGDQVMWTLEKGDSGIVHTILPRRSLLSRGEGHGKVKPIAANIDIMAIVMSPPPVLTEYLIDRYLVAAELVGIQPVLVLNKMDLLDESAKSAVLTRLKSYEALGYSVIFASTYIENGLSALSEVLKGKSAVLVGPSGVGKSSIISALTQEDIRVSAVSDKGAGKHTTTATKLYHLSNNTNLIDSPGVREFNLWSITKEEVMKSFKEISSNRDACQFRDCAHIKEPNCAVQQAVSDGRMSAARYENYQTLLKQADVKKYS